MLYDVVEANALDAGCSSERPSQPQVDRTCRTTCTGRRVPKEKSFCGGRCLSYESLSAFMAVALEPRSVCEFPFVKFV